MKRLLALVACAAAIAGACTKPGSVAANVNGVRITNQSLVDELNVIKGSSDLTAYYQTGGATVLGAKPGTFNGDFVSQLLSVRIQYELLHQDLAHRHITPDDTCRTAGQDSAYSEIGNGDLDKGRQALDAIPSWYRDVLVTREVDLLTLEASLINQPCRATDAARSYYDAHKADFDESCISLIELTDPSQVDSVMAQLRGGADFATVAKASSADAASAAEGGDVGCISRNQLPAQVVDAAFNTPIGGIADPIQTTQGTLILKITDRKTPAYSDVESQAAQLAQSASGDALRQWFSQVVANAVVHVDPRYGTWDTQQGGLQPPTTSSASTESTSSSS